MATSPEAPALQIRILGNLELRSGEAPLPPLESARAVSLLGYLLVHREAAQPRQRLAFLLWPDSTEAQARTNLRHVLHTLRRALPDADRFLEVTPRTLRWRADAPCRLDLADFEQALAAGRLEEAVDAVRRRSARGQLRRVGARGARAAAQRAALDALERLGRRHEERGGPAAAIRCAERLVRLDPLREDAHRALMRLHDARGDRARALRAYHACAATLQRELGIEPSAPTRAAYEALLLRRPGRSLRTARLAGRAAARRARARAGAADRALALGPARPRAARARHRRAGHRQEPAGRGAAVVVRARGARRPPRRARTRPRARSPTGRSSAWLRSEAIGTRLRRLDRAHLTELARLLPELAAELPDLPRPEPLPEPEQRRRLFAALARALLAPGAPLLLVADDLQWFDVPTLQFLHYLLRAEADGAPARRRHRAARGARRRRSRRRAGRRPAGARALLGDRARAAQPRPRPAVLAERMLGAPLGDAEAARLFAETEGNPLFVVEAVRARPRAPRRRPAAGCRRVIAARLARLSRAGARAGRRGRDDRPGVLGPGPGRRERRRRAGVRRRASTSCGGAGSSARTGTDAYDFSHGRIREAAYGALGPAQRRRHHLRVARALERAHAIGSRRRGRPARRPVRGRGSRRRGGRLVRAGGGRRAAAARPRRRRPGARARARALPRAARRPRARRARAGDPHGAPRAL